MRKKQVFYHLILFTLIIGFVLPAGASAQVQKTTPEPQTILEMKFKVFEGIREGRVEPVKTVTSSFLRYTMSANIKAEETAGKEENQIRRVFNLKGVQLLTEALLSWKKPGDKDFHIFRLDSKEYAVMITLVRVNSPEKVTCRLEVIEREEGKKSSLLDSELTLDRNSITTFGFEDNSGNPYFLSLNILKIQGKTGKEVYGVEGGVEHGIRGVIGGVQKPQEVELGKDVVRAIGEVMPPRLIKKVEPVYPEEARKAGVSGIVILEVQTDKTGHIKDIKVLRSIPLLDQAAIDAVKQWEYEPLIINGEPKEIIFTVTVSFRLK
jgi:TonB family protein